MINKQIYGIDSAFNKTKGIESSIIVERGCSFRIFGISDDLKEELEYDLNHGDLTGVTPEALNKKLQKYFKNKTVVDHGYVSTSAFGSAAESMHKGVKFEITVPKGSKVLPVNGYSKYPRENEILLPRGSALEVVGTSIEKDNTGSNYVLVKAKFAGVMS
jgi:hypothetical protein